LTPRTITEHLSRYRGVRQILIYNWPFYVAASLIDILAIIVISQFVLPVLVVISVFVVTVLVTFWGLSSLLVSYYVYDRSPLCKWGWLPALLNRPPRSWVNIHAGLDQTSDTLLQMFPGTERRVLDIYTPSEMSEPAIERARRSAAIPSIELANPFALPIEDRRCDTIFVIFAAHELRHREARVRFFCELRRVLERGGSILLVEHLRDWKNFLAYGPGVLHFFSRREWITVGSYSGLHVAREESVTPFVRCFVFTESAGRNGKIRATTA
jgi:SAM-dependent methyltransferase